MGTVFIDIFGEVVNPGLGNGNNVLPGHIRTLSVEEPIECPSDRFAPFNSLSRFDEPANLVDNVLLAVIRISFGLAGEQAGWFVKDDAIGKGAAARGDEGLIVLEAVDAVDYKASANSQFSTGF